MRCCELFKWLHAGGNRRPNKEGKGIEFLSLVRVCLVESPFKFVAESGPLKPRSCIYDAVCSLALILSAARRFLEQTKL